MLSPNSSESSSSRTTTGQWSPGASGNSAGRPIGSRNKSTVYLEELLRSRQDALIEKAIELALEKNDSIALRLCIERLLPVLKERRIELPLPVVNDCKQAAAAGAAILTGIGEGQITPGEGAVLAGIVEKQRLAITAQRAEESQQEREQESRMLAAEIEKLGRVSGTKSPENGDSKPALPSQAPEGTESERRPD